MSPGIHTRPTVFPAHPCPRSRRLRSRTRRSCPIRRRSPGNPDPGQRRSRHRRQCASSGRLPPRLAGQPRARHLDRDGRGRRGLPASPCRRRAQAGDGRIVVANGGSHRLLVFDEAGGYLTASGRRGQGPGDFSGSWGTNGLGPARVFWMEPWPGDSLAVCHAGSSAGARQFVSIWDTLRPTFPQRKDNITLCHV